MSRTKNLDRSDPQISFMALPEPGEENVPARRERFRLPVLFGVVPVDQRSHAWKVESRCRDIRITAKVIVPITAHYII